MKPLVGFPKPRARQSPTLHLRRAFLAVSLLLAGNAQAAFLAGEALDTAADVMSWVVLLVVPVVAIGAFWLVHILPEKIAEQKQHPQAKAIQTLCILSLFFGGLLWPLAWLWAYSKPVMYKMAYGTDKVPHGHEDEAQPAAHDDTEELMQLRQRIAEIEARRSAQPAAGSEVV